MHSTPPSTSRVQPALPVASSSAYSFVLFPAIAMMLGWGLRGFIGGGPFAAMIPGAFAALSLSLLLGHDRHTAAMTALFGAVAIGYGGEMTYGQTLGLACHPETMVWGLLGVTVKGAVWGLLGGAVLGTGLTVGQYKKHSLLLALLLSVVFLFIGWKLVNEPRLIYFSDPVNKPREELWAGLLFSALILLAFLYRKGDVEQAHIPVHFALWAALGGGIGFGGGTLFLVYGPQLPVPQEWFGWWKAMEFFFGLILGASIGIAAWLNRERLKPLSADNAYRQDNPLAAVVLVFVVAGYFTLFPAIEEYLGNPGGDSFGMAGLIEYNLFRPLYTFVFFGALCIAAGMYSLTAAWQVAITITVFHTVVDFNRNLSRVAGIEAPLWIQALILVFVTGLVAVTVLLLQNRARTVSRMYLLLLWVCFFMAALRTFLRRECLFPQEGADKTCPLMNVHPSDWTVFAVFVLTSIATALCIRHFSKRNLPLTGGNG